MEEQKHISVMDIKQYFYCLNEGIKDDRLAALVLSHIQRCESCKTLFEAIETLNYNTDNLNTQNKKPKI